MILTETLFDQDGKPLGKVHDDQFSGLVTFEPKDGNPRLAAKKWRNPDDCRKAVLNLYRGK